MRVWRVRRGSSSAAVVLYVQSGILRARHISDGSERRTMRLLVIDDDIGLLKTLKVAIHARRPDWPADFYNSFLPYLSKP
jgi:hypothetical protein